MNNILRPRHPLFALLMSLVLPGFGQLYNGEINRAIWLFLVFAIMTVPGVTLIALHLPSGWMMPCLIIALMLTVALWLFGMIDAWRGARRQPDYVPQAWQVSGIYLLVLILCDVIAFPLLTGYVRSHQVASFRIPSSSMEPSVLKGDIIFADKRYNCPGCKQEVKRGDIAIFTYPNNRTVYYIKRIIGLPGDQVQLRDHEIQVNGKSLKVNETVTTSGALVSEADGDRHWQVAWAVDEKHRPEADIAVPPGSVFVLGDNRTLSTDSRDFGTVPLQDVVGKARQIWFSYGDNGVRWARLGKVLD